MAGKIPGVEVARRRRFYGGTTGWSDSSFTINSALGYTRSKVFYHTHLTSIPCSHRSSDEDGKLGGVARKAKERLDGKLRSYWKSEISSQEKSEIETKPSNSMEVGNMQMEKKSGSKRFSWGILGLNWKSSDQNECAVCLEKFKFNEKLTRMPCAHRFHSMCLLPWLKSNAHCPCCRTSVLGSN